MANMSRQYADQSAHRSVATDSFLQNELARRAEARRADVIALGRGERDALIVPLILALARLSAQRDARR